MAIPRTRLPRRAAQEYFRNIRRLIEEDRQRVWKAWQDEIRPRIHGHRRIMRGPAINAAGTETGGFRANDDMDDINRILNRLRDMAMTSNFNEASLQFIARSFVNTINIRTRLNFHQQVMRVVGFDPTISEPWLSSFLETAVQENVSWIKSIGTEYHDKIKSIVTQGVRRGKSINDMASAVAEAGNVSIRRGRFIARDQLGSIHGDLVKARQTKLGLNRFRWRTSQDERVRDSHEDLDGQIFTWKDGARNERGERIWPGTDYACRCVAEPLEEELLGIAD